MRSRRSRHDDVTAAGGASDAERIGDVAQYGATRRESEGAAHRGSRPTTNSNPVAERDTEDDGGCSEAQKRSCEPPPRFGKRPMRIVSRYAPTETTAPTRITATPAGLA